MSEHGNVDGLDQATHAVRAGIPPAEQGAPLLPGPTFAAPFHLKGEPSSAPYFYGRYHNPTWTLYEHALGELERGDAVAFASGMAAVSAVLLPQLKPGDVLVLPSDGYYAVRALANGYLRERGVEIREVPTAGDAVWEALPGARLVLLETPSNPLLDVCDIAAISAAAHEHGALVAVDNTTATPLGQRPLELGADFSVAADTKGLLGHSDLVLGHVAVREAEHLGPLHEWRSQIGAIPGPAETWIAHRSLATAELRGERQCETALALARLLADRSDIGLLRYPGLEGDPAHQLAMRQMRRFGSMLSFELDSRERAESFLGACRLVAEATSFGGVHSTAERRARWGADAVGAGLIRLSVGCEGGDDLARDIEQALDAARST